MTLDSAKFKSLIKGTAISVSSKFPPYVDQLDTEQTLWLWLYDKRASVLKVVEDDPQNWERKIASTLRKVAFDHCAQEKAAAEGYSTEDLYRYSIVKIRDLAPAVFAKEAEGDQAELIDIREAVKRLPGETKELLYLVHVSSYTPENLAEHFSISLDAAKKRSQRAYGALQRELGRKGPEEVPKRPDRRMVRSNRAWQASRSAQYEG